MYYKQYEYLNRYLSAQNSHWYLQFISIVVSVIGSNLGSFLANPSGFTENFLNSIEGDKAVTKTVIIQNIAAQFLDEFKDELIVENIISWGSKLIFGVNDALAEQLGELFSFGGESFRTSMKVASEVINGNFQSLADHLRSIYSPTSTSITAGI